MGPRVAGDLVAFVMHAIDHGRPRISGVVDLPFAIVVARDEKCYLRLIPPESIQEIIGIDIRSINKGQGYGTWHLQSVKKSARGSGLPNKGAATHCAVIYVRQSVCDAGSPGAEDGRRVGTRKDHIVVTSRTVSKLTEWRPAEVLPLPTITLKYGQTAVQLEVGTGSVHTSAEQQYPAAQLPYSNPHRPFGGVD